MAVSQRSFDQSFGLSFAFQAHSVFSTDQTPTVDLLFQREFALADSDTIIADIQRDDDVQALGISIEVTLDK